MSEMTHFEGTCDICGEPISLDWDFAGPGVIDIGIDGDLVYTWIRHYATAPEGANPDCAKYFSTVYEVKEER